MPTNANAYNTRLTDESLEKRFRDTFRSQGGAELVDDLYASGVIVPVVDFTAAAEGSALRQDLQTAWDFTTDLTVLNQSTETLTSTAGFWQVDLQMVSRSEDAIITNRAYIGINNGLTVKKIWQYTSMVPNTVEGNDVAAQNDKFVVFLRSQDSLEASSAVPTTTLNVWIRQIADASGNLVQPSGFTSS